MLLQPPKPIRLWGPGFRVEGLGFVGFALTSTRNWDLSEASKPRAFVKTQMRKPAWSLNRRILSSRVPKTCIPNSKTLSRITGTLHETPRIWDFETVLPHLSWLAVESLTSCNPPVTNFRSKFIRLGLTSYSSNLRPRILGVMTHHLMRSYKGCASSCRMAKSTSAEEPDNKLSHNFSDHVVLISMSTVVIWRLL